MSDRVRIERDGDVAEVVLNRPDKHNGLDWPLIEALLDTASALRKERSLRGVILRGAGPSFCAGLDFAAMGKTPQRILQAFVQPGSATTNLFQEVSLRWRRVGVPVVAAIHGNCFGGGLQIALGCDFRFATPDARLSIMESKWGLVPDMGAMVTLPELMPADRARELTMTGRIVSGTEAAALNLVTRAVDDPVAEARAVLAEIATRSPDCIAGTKDLFRRAWMADEAAALRAERRVQRRLLMGRNQKIATERNLKGKDTPFEPRKYRN